MKMYMCKHLIKADSWDRKTDTFSIIKICGYQNKFFKNLCIENNCSIKEL